MIKKLGLFGGSFDPIHQRHMNIGREALKQFGLDQVVFIPTANPPHKALKNISDQARLEMTKLATVNEKNFVVSDIEVLRRGTSYTVDTLRWFKHRYPEAEIYFIIGQDTLSQLESWKEAEVVYSLCHFLVAPRTKERIALNEEELRAKGIRFSYIDMPLEETSSTHIRRQLSSGKMPPSLPGQVAGYIYTLGLYGFPSPFKELGQGYLSHLALHLGPYRLAHSLSTMATAMALAKTHGVPLEQGALAGLLHDCAKEKTLEQMQKLLKNCQAQLSARVWNAPSLLHGFAGASLAQQAFHVQDEEVLNAIAYHTIGTVPMTDLEIIIFIADGIEPMRGETEESKKIAKMAHKDLKQALSISLEGAVASMLARGKEIEPTIYKMMNWLR